MPLTRKTDEQAQMLINLKDAEVNRGLAHESTAIAHQSKLIAERTQKDSTAMVTMAVLTIFFLPSTFIAALFSTVFFDINSNGTGLTVHQGLWIYVVVAIILTVLVMAVWIWLYRSGPTSVISMFKLRRHKSNGNKNSADNKS